MPLPRISVEELDGGLRELLGPRVRRLGYVGEFFRVGAHQPDALAHFVRFTEALKDALPWRLVEIVALTVARATGNAYERVQHERLALRLGMPEAQVRDVLAGRVGPPAFSEPESLAQRIALDAVERAGRGAGPLVERLAALSGPAVAVATVLTASRYLAHSAASNAWGLEPPVTSPLDPRPTNV
jgi:alkylhydroperoxidase family enzyme